MLEHLMQPISLGDVEVPTRVVMTTHGPRLPQDRYLRYLAERASRGVGLVGLSAGIGVSNFPLGPGRGDPGRFGDFDAVPPDPLSEEGIAANDELLVAYLRRQVDAVHDAGARCVGQLLHTGANQNADTFQPVIAPSSVVDEHRRHVPHELTIDEIQRLVAAFGHAARRVMMAGADGVEIHAAHGYLIQQFLSPSTNRRADAYGGNFEQRLGFLLEVLDAVRAHVPEGSPVGVRLNADDATPVEDDPFDAPRIAQTLDARGVDFLHVSGGTYTGLQNGVGLAYVASRYEPTAPNAGVAREITESCGAPVILSGRLIELEQGEEIVASGGADMIGLTRALIADPEIVPKTRTGRGGAVVRCIGCNECHRGTPVTCSVNPAAGREDELAIRPATDPKHVVVVGGGPAGLEAARIAALRGHRATLVERGSDLGGLIGRVGRADRHRGELALFAAQLAERTVDAGVSVHLRTTATAELIDELSPDALAVATGTEPYVPDIPGVRGDNVFTAVPALEHSGGWSNVVVVGGLDDQLPPLTVADHLVGAGCRVEVVTELLTPGDGLEPATRFALLGRLLGAGATIHTLSRVTAIGPDHVETANTLTGEHRVLSGFDAVVLACGRRANGDLSAELRCVGVPYQLLGDCQAPRRLVHATLEGARWGATV